MIAAAIDEAVDRTKVSLLEKIAAEEGQTANTDTPKTVQANVDGFKKPAKSPGEVIHESNMDVEIVDDHLRQLIKAKYGTAGSFFNDVTKRNGISRKEWKAALQRLGMVLGDGEHFLICKYISNNF